MSEGKLQCVHCGQKFLLSDGEHVTINHFRTCTGLDDE